MIKKGLRGNIHILKQLTLNKEIMKVIKLWIL